MNTTPFDLLQPVPLTRSASGTPATSTHSDRAGRFDERLREAKVAAGEATQTRKTSGADKRSRTDTDQNRGKARRTTEKAPPSKSEGKSNRRVEEAPSEPDEGEQSTTADGSQVLLAQAELTVLVGADPESDAGNVAAETVAVSSDAAAGNGELAAQTQTIAFDTFGTPPADEAAAGVGQQVPTETDAGVVEQTLPTSNGDQALPDIDTSGVTAQLVADAEGDDTLPQSPAGDSRDILPALAIAGAGELTSSQEPLGTAADPEIQQSTSAILDQGANNGDASGEGQRPHSGTTDSSTDAAFAASREEAATAPTAEREAITATASDGPPPAESEANEPAPRQAASTDVARRDGLAETLSRWQQTGGRSTDLLRRSTNDGGTRVDAARFVGRVARAFHIAEQRGGNLTLRLSPPELGSLRLEVSVREGVLLAAIDTETPAARQLLLDNLPALRDRLAEQNIRVEKFDIDVRQDGQGSREFAEPRDRNASQERSHGERTWTRLPAAGDDTPAPLVHVASITDANIDLVI